MKQVEARLFPGSYRKFWYSYSGIQVGCTIMSDRRLKSEIINSNSCLYFINMLNPVFCLRLNDETKKKEYGFITHEIEETLSKLGSTNTGMLTNDDTGMYSVHYNDMFVLMEKAMQELQVIFEDAKVEISSLEAEHSSFIAKISSLQDPNKQLENRLKAIEDNLKL